VVKVVVVLLEAHLFTKQVVDQVFIAPLLVFTTGVRLVLGRKQPQLLIVLEMVAFVLFGRAIHVFTHQQTRELYK
jgi:hypothetical protein